MLSRASPSSTTGGPGMKIAIALLTTVVVLAGSGSAIAGEGRPVCIGLKAGGIGSPRIELSLSADDHGAFIELVGEARFSQPITPPASLVIYSVTGAAIPNEDGFWVSLKGAGYDLARTVFNGTFAIQASADPAKNSLTYAKQSLDGSSTVVFTGTPELRVCP